MPEPTHIRVLSDDDAQALRRISMTLHRWHELECGDSNHAYPLDTHKHKPYIDRCRRRFCPE